QQKKQSMSALLAILRRRAEKQPVLFVVEDLHWVDPTTVEFLHLLVEHIRDSRILALLTSRPDFRNPWQDNADVTKLPLDRLPPDETVELIRRVAGGGVLPDEIVADVVAKTDGVPLFIEELTKTLLESDLLEQRHGRYQLSSPLPPMAIPSTLHDSLMARLDRLAATKGLAQLGAAIGREFSYALIRTVSPWDEELLQHGLAQLVAAEFLYQYGSPPLATYRFKHALIQDAAYQSLLKSTRQRHHQRIGAALESHFPDIVDTRPEVVAQHYTEAGLITQAVPYWLAAGRRALHAYANLEATNHARRGLELLARLPDSPERARQELALQLVLAPSLSFVQGPQSVQGVYERARELARQVGGTPELFPALSGLAYAQIVRGRIREARALAEEFLALAGPHNDALVSAVGHSMVAYAAWWQGDFPQVREHSLECMAVYDPARHCVGVTSYNQNPGIICGYLGALANWVLGYPDAAVDAMARAVAHAKALAQPYSLGLTLLFAAQLFQLRRDATDALRFSHEAIAVASEHGLFAVELWCLLPRGWAKAQQGDVPAGIADIREAMDRRRAVNIGAVWPWFLTLLAECEGAQGHFDEALQAVNEAHEWVQRNDERLYAAEAHRVHGELLLRRPEPDPVQAQKCFEQALAVARDAQAKSWELRAATSMARLWQSSGRRDDARELLAPVYGWFTEGFDTADLQDAKALLAQLS
ncbi:MAG: ATP-binding protein, partial [Mycobacterium sp.]